MMLFEEWQYYCFSILSLSKKLNLSDVPVPISMVIIHKRQTGRQIFVFH